MTSSSTPLFTNYDRSLNTINCKIVYFFWQSSILRPKLAIDYFSLGESKSKEIKSNYLMFLISFKSLDLVIAVLVLGSKVAINV